MNTYLSVFTLPYTLFSLYYQKMQVRKWCPFCLMVLLMLWLSFACYLSFGPSKIILTGESFYLSGFVFGVLAFLWLCIKPSFEKAQRNFSLDVTLWKIKRDPLVFNILWDNQVSYNMEFNSADIQLGNTAAPITVTTLISERCEHCKKLVKTIIENLNGTNHPSFNWIISFVDLGVRDEINSPFFCNLYNLYHYCPKKFSQT